jgi:hypothetical protein
MVPLLGAGKLDSDRVMAGGSEAVPLDPLPERAQPQPGPAPFPPCTPTAAMAGALSCPPHPHSRAQESNEETASGKTDVDSRPIQVRTNQVPDKDDW